MTNITDQDCFQAAVDIASWPAALGWDGNHWMLESQVDGTWEPTAEWHAHALLEKHFRERLEERNVSCEFARVEGAAVYQAWDNTAWAVMAEADDYLKCLCLAVIECDKKERNDA